MPSDDLARCDREIAEMLSQSPDKPAWLVTLGVHDWMMERELILRESVQVYMLDSLADEPKTDESKQAAGGGPVNTGAHRTSQGSA